MEKPLPKLFTICHSPVLLLWVARARKKTDNAPAYCSTALSTFCAQWDVRLKHGIPYNSTGQAIVERANRTLKTLLDKQLKQGELCLRTLGDIQQQMHILLFTLNNLTLNADQQTPTDRHFHKWKDCVSITISCPIRSGWAQYL
ncbi:unnamed protein product [Natator depressus]